MLPNRAVIFFLFCFLSSPGATPLSAGIVAGGEGLEKQTRAVLYTYVTIIATGPKEKTVKAVNKAYERLRRLESKFSTGDPKSPLFKFNRNGVPIRDPEVIGVIRKAARAGELTDGAFDITIYPIVRLWGFFSDSPHMPPETEIKNALKTVGYGNLHISSSEVRAVNPGVSIDLGGIAKGYAIGQAIETLKKEGVTAAVVEAGGDVYAMGLNKGKPWNIGIQHPRGEDGLLGYLAVSDTAVMGSGDYRKFFIKDGKRYHHIIDPRTGYPAKTVMGATVVYNDPAVADAWATALCVMTPEQGLERIKEVPGMEAVIVDMSGKVFYSAGLGKLLGGK